MREMIQIPDNGLGEVLFDSALPLLPLLQSFAMGDVHIGCAGPGVCTNLAVKRSEMRRVMPISVASFLPPSRCLAHLPLHFSFSLSFSLVCSSLYLSSLLPISLSLSCLFSPFPGCLLSLTRTRSLCTLECCPATPVSVCQPVCHSPSLPPSLPPPHTQLRRPHFSPDQR